MTTTTVGWGNAVVISSTKLRLKKWVHTAATYDDASGEGKVYIDGEVDNEGDIGGKIITNDVVLCLDAEQVPFLMGILTKFVYQILLVLRKKYRC